MSWVRMNIFNGQLQLSGELEMDQLGALLKRKQLLMDSLEPLA
ncbi:hypothetical protein [Paenibacillus sp. 1A_MP2]